MLEHIFNTFSTELDKHAVAPVTKGAVKRIGKGALVGGAAAAGLVALKHYAPHIHEMVTGGADALSAADHATHGAVHGATHGAIHGAAHGASYGGLGSAFGAARGAARGAALHSAISNMHEHHPSAIAQAIKEHWGKGTVVTAGTVGGAIHAHKKGKDKIPLEHLEAFAKKMKKHTDAMKKEASGYKPTSSAHETRKNVGTVTGAILGGVAGAAAGAPLIGAGAGAYAGRKIGDKSAHPSTIALEHIIEMLDKKNKLSKRVKDAGDSIRSSIKVMQEQGKTI